MNGYVIAEAIDKFTREYKKIISERNNIENDKLKFEKEKLNFEKEKFEFSKQQFELNESLKDDLNKNSINNEFPCPHHWILDSMNDCPSDFTRKARYRCSICGEYKTEIIEDYLKNRI